jgi:hypothetical protein
LSAAILERLAAEGVRTLEQWRALGRRRHELFGVTRRVAEQLDALAKLYRPDPKQLAAEIRRLHQAGHSNIFISQALRLAPEMVAKVLAEDGSE